MILQMLFQAHAFLVYHSHKNLSSLYILCNIAVQYFNFLNIMCGLLKRGFLKYPITFCVTIYCRSCPC